jgi:hypothetical protein
MPGRDGNGPTPATRPIHYERSGSVEAVVWERHVDEDGHVGHKVALDALRRDPGGEVRRGATFAEAELRRAIECARIVRQWCVERQRVFDPVADANRPTAGPRGPRAVTCGVSRRPEGHAGRHEAQPREAGSRG